MSEKEKVYYKRKTANWRKRYFYDYLGGELSRETRMMQWTHTMIEDIIFDLGQQNRFLSFDSAIRRYKLNQKIVEQLISKRYIEAKIDKNNENNLWLFSRNVDDNLTQIDEEGKRGFMKQANRKDRSDTEYRIEEENDDDEYKDVW